jgi:uncharacterized membrane protein
MANAEDSFTLDQRDKILASIKEAEQQTSGCIRLFIENKCKGDVLDRAAFIFTELDMHETKHRNTVLIYLALKSHKFAVIGDAGIHSKAREDFWQDIKAQMQTHFVKGDFVGGLTTGIYDIGEALKKHFPHNKEDINELPDDIVFGKK